MSSNNHAGRNVVAVEFVNQLDVSGKFQISGRRFRVTDRLGSVYVIDDRARTISKDGEEPRPGFVQGATFGGSMLMPGVLLPDAYMEYVMKDEDEYGRTYRSSLVVSVDDAI